jgi:5,10-methylenetetrahydromethanopterin reductase
VDLRGTEAEDPVPEPGGRAINLDDPIPLHVAAMGPRARRLAAKLGAGLVHATGSVAHAGAGIADMQAAWREAGRDPADLHCDGRHRRLDPPRGRGRRQPPRQGAGGPTATVALHSLVEREAFGDLGRPLPPEFHPLLERYRQIYRGYEPADARYLSNHRGHLMFLRPEEHEVCTAELIRATTFTASRDELRERIRALAVAGFSHLGIMIRHGHPQMLEDGRSCSTACDPLASQSPR